MAYKPQFIDTIQQYGQSFVNADGTTVKILATAGSKGTRIEHLVLWCDEAKTVNIYRANSSGTILTLIAQVVFTAATMSAIDVLALLHTLPEKQFLLLKGGEKITWAPTVAVTAAKTLYASADGGDF